MDKVIKGVSIKELKDKYMKDELDILVTPDVEAEEVLPTAPEGASDSKINASPEPQPTPPSTASEMGKPVEMPDQPEMLEPVAQATGGMDGVEGSIEILATAEPVAPIIDELPSEIVDEPLEPTIDTAPTLDPDQPAGEPTVLDNEPVNVTAPDAEAHTNQTEPVEEPLSKKEIFGDDDDVNAAGHEETAPSMDTDASDQKEEEVETPHEEHEENETPEEEEDEEGFPKKKKRAMESVVFKNAKCSVTAVRSFGKSIWESQSLKSQDRGYIVTPKQGKKVAVIVSSNNEMKFIDENNKPILRELFDAYTNHLGIPKLAKKVNESTDLKLDAVQANTVADLLKWAIQQPDVQNSSKEGNAILNWVEIGQRILDSGLTQAAMDKKAYTVSGSDVAGLIGLLDWAKKQPEVATASAITNIVGQAEEILSPKPKKEKGMDKLAMDTSMPPMTPVDDIPPASIDGSSSVAGEEGDGSAAELGRQADDWEDTTNSIDKFGVDSDVDADIEVEPEEEEVPRRPRTREGKEAPSAENDIDKMDAEKLINTLYEQHINELGFSSKEEFMDYISNTLIPDLEASGHTAMVEDWNEALEWLGGRDSFEQGLPEKKVDEKLVCTGCGKVIADVDPSGKVRHGRCAACGPFDLTDAEKKKIEGNSQVAERETQTFDRSSDRKVTSDDASASTPSVSWAKRKKGAKVAEKPAEKPTGKFVNRVRGMAESKTKDTIVGGDMSINTEVANYMKKFHNQ